MKVAVSGKGGSGKTTISGTLARLVGRSGTQVLAIDADTNPNLALTLGMQPDDFERVAPVPHGLMEHRNVDGGTRLALKLPLAEVTTQYACEAPDNVRLMMVGQVRGAGAG